MGKDSAIEWTEATWNPTTGCTKISPACSSCYIERTPPFRIRGRKFVKGHIPIVLHPDRLDGPLRRKTPTVYFVNSLSDLFHQDVPDTFIDRVFAVMALAPQHTFQILTKRAERMRAYCSTLGRHHEVDRVSLAAKALQPDGPGFWWGLGNGGWCLPNVWLGVSVENQRFAAERIPLLLQTPAAVRFISAEPLLGPVDLTAIRLHNGGLVHALGGTVVHSPHDAGSFRGLDWVIVGGESGPRVRPTDPAWVRSVRDQCVSAGVAFFFKQWGGRTPKAGGRMLDGREHNDLPAVPRG